MYTYVAIHGIPKSMYRNGPVNVSCPVRMYRSGPPYVPKWSCTELVLLLLNAVTQFPHTSRHCKAASVCCLTFQKVHIRLVAITRLGAAEILGGKGGKGVSLPKG